MRRTVARRAKAKVRRCEDCGREMPDAARAPIATALRKLAADLDKASHETIWATTGRAIAALEGLARRADGRLCWLCDAQRTRQALKEQQAAT